MADIIQLIEKGERGNIEFKEYLTRNFHLKRDRKESLASQMKYRLNQGEGEAVYLLGVTDDGEGVGLGDRELRESLEVLEEIAGGVGLGIDSTETVKQNGRKLCRVNIREHKPGKEHLLIASAGHVDHGKSTLIGSLISGLLDRGDESSRRFLDTLKHEMERGLSAELSYAVYGFNERGEEIHLSNPRSKKSRAEVVKKARKLVSFVDTVGHEPWLRTTIRGIVGQKLDYGMLTVAADDGITSITKEHLGIFLAMDLPVVIAITKADKARNLEKLERDISELLTLVGKVGKRINSKRDVEQLGNFPRYSVLVPVVVTSARTGEGLELMHHLFYHLPQSSSALDAQKDFMMYIDKVYSVPGAGMVVSGSIKQGSIEVGKRLYLGPDKMGRFHQVKVASIEMHYHGVDKARVGEVVGVAIKGYKGEITRGMVLTDKDRLQPARSFEAHVAILNHPTRVARGYEPIIHLETVSEAVSLEPLEQKFLTAGDRGKVRMSFKYSSHYVEEGMKFIFREGRSKGLGVITRVLG